MTAGTASVLIGRDREVRALTELIGQGTKTGQALVLLGDPGIGKSALLAAAQGAARAAGFRVLSGVGVESEAQLPFAGLHQMPRRRRCCTFISATPGPFCLTTPSRRLATPTS